MSLRSKWGTPPAWTAVALSLGLIVVGFPSDVGAQQRRPTRIAPPNDRMTQSATPQLTTSDAEADSVIRVVQARNQFALTGAGLTVAVMDTGLRTTHVDFAGKVLTVRNFTTDDGGNPNVVTDLNGHGTNVAGITVGNGIHIGIAPGANVIPLKVLSNTGGGSFLWLQNALDWVIANRTIYNITVVNMSLGATSNFTSDFFGTDPIQQRIAALRNARVAVCVAAGNDFFTFTSTEGMSYPGIFRETVSVGAVYDANIGGFGYASGAIAFTTGPKRITPFSQRLHSSTNPNTRTDVFAPGAAITAAGNLTDTGSSTFHGTSQATPVVAGLCVLLQQHALKRTGQLPTVAQLEKWLAATTPATANTIFDGDDEDDNVTNTLKNYIMADAIEMINSANKDLIPQAPTTSNAVTASYNSITKTLTLSAPDNLANSITLTRQGSKLVITAGSGTKVNNSNTVTFTIGTAPIKVTGDMAGGNDTVNLLSMSISLIDLNLGDGNDKIVMSYCTVATSSVDGGTGTDSIVTSTSKITTNTNVGFP
jgi:hypothetical protein